jgi:polar amino acid transport system substrate-binding protein
MLRLALTSLLLAASTAIADSVEVLVYPVAGIFDIGPADEIRGPGKRVLARIEALSGVTLHTRVLPGSRVLRSVLAEPGVCAAGMARLPEREANLHWTGVLASGTMTLYGRHDETRRITGVADLRGASIVARRESGPAAWLREHGIPAHEVRDTATSLRMLQNRRVDYWLVNELSVRHELTQLGGATPPKPLHEFGRLDAYLACNKQTREDILARLQAAVAQLKRDGELEFRAAR